MIIFVVIFAESSPCVTLRRTVNKIFCCVWPFVAWWIKYFTVRLAVGAQRTVTVVLAPPANRWGAPNRWGAHENGVCRASEGGARRRFVFSVCLLGGALRTLFSPCLLVLRGLLCGAYGKHPIRCAPDIMPTRRRVGNIKILSFPVVTVVCHKLTSALYMDYWVSHKRVLLIRSLDVSFHQNRHKEFTTTYHCTFPFLN